MTTLNVDILRALEPVRLVFDTSSLFCAFVTMFTVLLLRQFQPTLGRSVSFQLSFWIGLTDAAWHFSGIFLDIPQYLVTHYQNTSLLVYLNWSSFFFPMLATMLMTCVALDLHLAFVLRSPWKARLSPFYAPAALVVSVGTTLPLLFLLSYTFYPVLDYTGMGSTTSTSFGVLLWVCFSGWMIAAVSYCFTVVAMVIYKLLQGLRELRNISSPLNSRRRETFDATMHQVVRRLIFYPMVPIICQTFNIFLPVYTYIYPSVYPTWLTVMISVPQALQGTLNFVAFLLNPALHRAWYNFKRDMVKNYIMPGPLDSATRMGAGSKLKDSNQKSGSGLGSATANNSYQNQSELNEKWLGAGQNGQNAPPSFQWPNNSVSLGQSDQASSMLFRMRDKLFRGKGPSAYNALMRWVVGNFFISERIATELAGEYERQCSRDTSRRPAQNSNTSVGPTSPTGMDSNYIETAANSTQYTSSVAYTL